MFIEVNYLKGLIINLETFPPEVDTDWIEISKAVKCVFICSDEKRKDALRQNCTADIFFLESPSFFFFKNNLIRDALKMMAFQPFEVAYVTNSFSDLSSALQEPIGTILIQKGELKFDQTGQLPDFRLEAITAIMDVINGTLGGYFSEIYTNLGTPVSKSKLGLLLLTTLNSDNGSFAVVAGGRYFPSKHTKQRTHQLSRRILRSKEDTSQDYFFSRIFKGLVDFTNNKVKKVDGVTRVPPRPDGRRDRLLPSVEYICKEKTYKNLSSNLICLTNYESQKGLGRDLRIENIKGKFLAKELNGMHVVLLDDVLTTGATTTECVNALYNAGASQVTVVVLCINQFDETWRTPQKLICSIPNCDGERFLKIKKDGTSSFFMCSNYFKNKCKGLDYFKGWQEVNKLNSYDEENGSDEFLIF